MARNNIKTGTEAAVSVGESLIIKVLDSEGQEVAQMTLTADWVLSTVIPPEPEPPPVDGITEKIYKPEEFNGDCAAMGQKILVDQEAAGDGLLRAVVQFERGQTYTYAQNNFMSGVQCYRCEATGSGDKPKLRCTNTSSGFAADKGPLNIGRGANCFIEAGVPLSKTKQMALIETARSGEEWVRLLNVVDVSKLMVGRWHAVFSYCQQLGGYPPNVRWIDFVKVVSITDDRVELDRSLTHNHFDDYWEDPNDEASIGKARIGLWDAFDGHTRCCLEGVWRGLEFVGEGASGTDTMIFESHIDVLFEDCILSNPWPSMLKRCEFRNCVLTGAGDQGAEPDKLSDTLIFDGVTQARTNLYIGGATGFQHFEIRNSNLNCFQVKPRHLDISNSVLDSHGDMHLYVPVGWSYNGPILEATFVDCDIRATTAAQPTWVYSQAPVTPLPLSGSAWQGSKLIIRRDFSGFQNWLVWAYEGCMVFTGPRVGDPRNYGRIDKIYAPPDGSALWLDVTWLKGTKPTSGNLNIGQHGLRKLTWTRTQITAGNWTEPDFVAMEGTPADRQFPSGVS